MRLNNRGISIGISQFILTLAVGAVVIYLVTESGKDILPGAKQSTMNATANQGTTWIQQVPGLLPITIALLAFFGLIVLAVYQREIG